jgi:uncharacterized membrane protein
VKTRLTSFIRSEWLQLLLLALPFAAALIAMPYASDRVPMQWGADGRVNWYAPKPWGLLIVPLTMLPTIALVYFMESRDTQRLHEDGSLTPHGLAVRAIRLAVSFLLAAVCGLQIAAALGAHPNMAKIVPVAIGLLFAFMGRVFGKLKPNRYAGIRVPWTMNSETVWLKTHRIAGQLWMITGLAFAVSAWLIPPALITSVMLWWVGLLLVLPLAVAWREAQREKRSKASK